MSSFKKALERLKNKPSDLKWNEINRILKQLGYDQLKSGKTSGSRVKFYNKDKKSLLSLHKPHNPEIVRKYQIEYILTKLKEDGVI